MEFDESCFRIATQTPEENSKLVEYISEPYLQFGRVAARMDDVANYLPSRLTALLMILVSGKRSLIRFVRTYGRRHASPNAGYPEAALAGILQCRFGGPASYFGKRVNKPYIGHQEKTLIASDLHEAVRINRYAERMMVFVTVLIQLPAGYLFL
jgi:adenosylcobinamide-phosphate synthase